MLKIAADFQGFSMYSTEDQSTLASLACLIGCHARYLSLFFDAMDKEFLPRENDVVFDWEQNLRLARTSVVPIDKLLDVVIDAQPIADIRVIDDRRVTHGQFAHELKVRLDFASMELRAGHFMKAKEHVHAAFFVASVWKRETYGNLRSAYPELAERLGDEFQALHKETMTGLDGSESFQHLKALWGDVPNDYFVSRQEIQREFEFKRRGFREALKELVSDDWAAWYRVCMASRKYSLAFVFAAYFAAIMHGDCDIDTERARILDLYDEAIGRLPDVGPQIADKTLFSRIGDIRCSLTARARQLQEWQPREYAIAALSPDV